MSHETRTSLHNVIGMADLLRALPLDTQPRGFVDSIRSDARRLLETIDGILDLCRLDRRELRLDSAAFDLEEFVGDLQERALHEAHASGFELAVLVQPEVPRRLRGDPARLRQVLLSLIARRLRVADHGQVSIHIDLVEAEPERSRLRFSVSHPHPVPDSILARHPTTTTPADRGPAAAPGAPVDFGHLLADRLLQLMGGKLDFPEQAGNDSHASFVVTLPTIPGPTQPPPLAGRHIVVHSPSVPLSRSLALLISGWGAGVHVETDSGSIRSRLSDLDPGAAFRPVVLLDSRSSLASDPALFRDLAPRPGSPGFGILRLTPVPDGARPATHVPGTAAESAVLPLPPRPSELLAGLLAQATPIAPVQAPAPATAPSPGPAAPSASGGAARRPALDPLPPLRILVVEDNAMNRRLAEHMLRQLHCPAEFAVNGLEALEAVARTRYDAVLMDCQMPEMDGLTATREIRRREAERNDGWHLPIIAVTANALIGDRNACLAAGMDDYLSKPVRLDVLHAALRRIGHPTASLPAPPPAPPPVLDGLLSDFGPETASELIGSFLEDTPARLRRLREYSQNGAAEDFARAVHSLAGSSGIFGLDRIRRAALATEEDLRAGRLGSAGARIADLETEFAAAAPALESCLRRIRAASGPGVSPGPSASRPA